MFTCSTIYNHQSSSEAQLVEQKGLTGLQKFGLGTDVVLILLIGGVGVVGLIAIIGGNPALHSIGTIGNQAAIGMVSGAGGIVFVDIIAFAISASKKVSALQNRPPEDKKNRDVIEGHIKVNNSLRRELEEVKLQKEECSRQLDREVLVNRQNEVYNNELHAKLQEGEKLLEKLRQQLKDLEESTSSNQTAETHYLGQLKSVIDSKKVLEERIEQLEKQLAQQSKPTEELNKQLDDAQRQNEQLEEQIKELKSQLDTEAQKQQAELERLRVLKEANSSLENTVRELETQLADQTRELTNKLKKAERQNEELEEQIRVLNKKIAAETDKEQSRLEELKQLREAKAALQDVVDQLDKQIEILKTQLSDAENQIEEAEAQNKQFEDEIRQLKQDAKQALENELKDVNQQIKKAEDELKRLQMSKRLEQDELNIKSKEVEQIYQQIAQLQKEKRSLEASPVSNLNGHTVIDLTDQVPTPTTTITSQDAEESTHLTPSSPRVSPPETVTKAPTSAQLNAALSKHSKVEAKPPQMNQANRDNLERLLHNRAARSRLNGDIEGFLEYLDHKSEKFNDTLKQKTKKSNLALKTSIHFTLEQLKEIDKPVQQIAIEEAANQSVEASFMPYISDNPSKFVLDYFSQLRTYINEKEGDEKECVRRIEQCVKEIEVLFSSKNPNESADRAATVKALAENEARIVAEQKQENQKKNLEYIQQALTYTQAGQHFDLTNLSMTSTRITAKDMSLFVTTIQSAGVSDEIARKVLSTRQDVERLVEQIRQKKQAIDKSNSDEVQVDLINQLNSLCNKLKTILDNACTQKSFVSVIDHFFE